MLKDLTVIKEAVVDFPIVKENSLSDFRLPESLQKKLKDFLKDKGYDFNLYTSYAITDKATSSKPANYAIIPNQYFAYAGEMYEFAIELYEYFKIYEKLRAYSNDLLGNALEIENKIKLNPNMYSLFDSDDDVRLFSRFIDKDDSTYRLNSKRLINDQGQPRGARDCFGSVILKEINLPDTSSSIFGRLLFDLSENNVLFATLKEFYKKEISSNGVSSGIVLFQDTKIRKFVYGVIDTITKRGDAEFFFNSLTILSDDSKIYAELVNQSDRVYRMFRVSETALTEDDLKSGGNLRWFSDFFRYNEKNFYLTNQWEDTDAQATVSRNLQLLMKLFNALDSEYSIETSGGVYKLLYRSLKKLDLTKLPKPFLLLAGISGTGKTRFVRKQAEEHNVGEKNFCLVPVRPDWHEPSDLLGYVSRISGKPEYVSTKVIQFIIEAWKAIAPNADKNGMGVLDYSSPPYWLCLDEMNLAPVEQYFADYLSVLESREFNDGEYRCEPLLDKSVLSTSGDKVQEDLKLGHDQNLWEFFLENGISIPPNLIVAGTVNMDETTHGFSRKVIDRALTIDFGEFYPNDYSKFFNGQHKPKILTYSLNTQITASAINCPIDTDGEITIQFLTAVNELLKKTPFELAYRALNELLLHVSCFAPETNEQLQAVWDDFLMTKVLPRIDGDEDKLRISDSNGVHNLLDKLEALLSVQLKDIWAIDKNRIDLLRVQHDDNPITDVACRSRIKIRWMKDRLDANTFTSFWP
jgi:hypothetical protein